jgi:hypothetical protein
MTRICQYESLHHFLQSGPLTVNSIEDDGFGEKYPIKGREIEATILFADMSDFALRTKMMSSTSTLAFANKFIAWLSGEALHRYPCIVDKYIGDALMIVFSNEFGSSDHFADALGAAKAFAHHDALGFFPHMGLASGDITAGYVGTKKYLQCSVFGRPVTIASRCASYRPDEGNAVSIVFPADLWKPEYFDLVFKPQALCTNKTGGIVNEFPAWTELEPRIAEFKRGETIMVKPVVKQESDILISERTADGNLRPTSVEEGIEQTLNRLRSEGKYTPRRNGGAV